MMGIERAPGQITVTDDADTVVVIAGTERHLDQLEEAFRRDLVGREPTLDHWDTWMDDLATRDSA